MCLKYNTNILVHDLAQKLNFYSKNNIFSGYLLEQNKSLKLKYRKKNLGQKNKSIKTLSEKKYIIAKPKDAKTLFKSAPKYLFPSMNNNLLCENLFQRKSQILPNVQNMSELYRYKYNSNDSKIFEKNNEKKKSRKKTVFLSTTSFDFKKRPSSKIKNKIFISNKKEIMNLIYNPKSKDKKPFTNINLKDSLKQKDSDITKAKSEQYYYIIRPENCGYLVKNCFKHRKNWKELENLESKNFNFKWQQNNYGINFNLLSINQKQLVNHFEYKNVISNKANLFLNMMEYAEMQDINIFKYVPFTVLFDYNKINFFNKIIKFEDLFKNITDYIVPI